MPKLKTNKAGTKKEDTRTKQLYLIAIPATGKSYVGQGYKPKQRYSSHKLAKNKFGRDLCKHEHTFKIFNKEYTPDDANIGEQKYIKKYNTLEPNGYNKNSGGNVNIPCDETRKKQSKSHTKYLAGLSDGAKKEWCDTLSIAQLKRYANMSEAEWAAMRERSKRGQAGMSEETAAVRGAKISAAKTKWFAGMSDEELRDFERKIRTGLAGRSEEAKQLHRANTSDAIKLWNANMPDDARAVSNAKRIKSMKGQKKTAKHVKNARDAMVLGKARALANKRQLPILRSARLTIDNHCQSLVGAVSPTRIQWLKLSIKTARWVFRQHYKQLSNMEKKKFDAEYPPAKLFTKKQVEKNRAAKIASKQKGIKRTPEQIEVNRQAQLRWRRKVQAA
ncbi:hypothetical protein LCGC14_2115080 [marine sediment metagenome]|uniref:GIY-YIG domain-containing protein n=1 Tax=marine sediment metagenome TaxID=412755 RepID=A0A0F9E5Z2_9ZZZZ